MELNNLTTRRLRGSASIAPDGSFDFRPQQTSEERRTLVRKTQNGSALYRTAVNERLSVSLTAPQGIPDPEAWMAREMNELLSQNGSKPRVKETGCLLAKTPRTELRIDQRAGVLRALIVLPLQNLNVVPHLASETAILLSHASVNREAIDAATERWMKAQKKARMVKKNEEGGRK